MFNPSDLPIGKAESLVLEFKAAAALRKPTTIAREVVAMLNASGGCLWIGIGEENSHAVSVEAIPDAHREGQALLNHLIDTLEPPPADELKVNTVAVGDAGEVLLVTVKKSNARKPFAQLKESLWRYYAIRVGDRVRGMTREELREAFGSRTADPSAMDKTINQMQKDIELERKSHGPGIWLFLRPSGNLPVRLIEARREIDPLLRDAAKTHNRRMGWNFTSSHNELAPMKGGLEFGKTKSYTHTKLYDNGGVLSFAPLERLQRNTPKVIFPLALLEYPTSLLRFGRIFYQQLFEIASDTRMICLIVLSGIRNWELKAHSPNSPFYSPPRMSPHTYDGADDLMLDPLIFSSSDLEKNPDACALRGIKLIYEAFGHGPEAVPEEFDQLHEVLRL